MGSDRSQQHKAISRKRKQEGIDCNFGANKKLWSWSDNGGGIDKLPDDILINILSHMSFKGAARTSVLTRRWRYLWRFVHGTLRFDLRNYDVTAGCKKFESWLNTVLKFHQGRNIVGIVVNFNAGTDLDLRNKTYCAVQDLVYFAIRKEVQILEVKLSLHNGYGDDVLNRIESHAYDFPSLESLISHSNGVSSSFRRLRTLRLSHVGIKDEVVHYFLASCPHLEELFIRFSYFVKNLRVVDPPSLRVLEITRCYNIQSLEISAVNLISLTYGGMRNSRLLLKKIPNVHKLTLIDDSCVHFLSEPSQHSSYLVQLEKLVLDIRMLSCYYSVLVAPPILPKLGSLKRLEVKVLALVGRKLLFTSLIEGSPHLREFRIELKYWVAPNNQIEFRGILSRVGKFVHTNLKVIEMTGYIGCHCSEELLLELTNQCPSLERIVIDTRSDYYDERIYGYNFADDFVTTRVEAKERAKRFASNIPKQIKVIVS